MSSHTPLFLYPTTKKQIKDQKTQEDANLSSIKVLATKIILFFIKKKWEKVK